RSVSGRVFDAGHAEFGGRNVFGVADPAVAAAVEETPQSATHKTTPPAEATTAPLGPGEAGDGEKDQNKNDFANGNLRGRGHSIKFVGWRRGELGTGKVNEGILIKG